MAFQRWQEPAPSFKPHNDEHAFKSARGSTRYVEEGGASFADVIIRVFFGYQPPLIWESVGDGDDDGGDDGGGGRGGRGDAGDDGRRSGDARLKQQVLWQPDQPRGFDGMLYGLRTPLGVATITSTKTGGLTITIK